MPARSRCTDWNGDGVLSGDEVSVGGIPPADTDESQSHNIGNADRFDYLDVNGNGVIERNEWDGGYDAFDRLDTKRDGRLTRAELNDGNTARAANLNSLDMNRDGEDHPQRMALVASQLRSAGPEW